MAGEFHVHRDTVSRIWNRYDRKATEINVNIDVGIVNSIYSQKASRRRSVKYDTVALAETLAEQPFETRQTVRSAATSLSVSTTTVFKAIRSGKVKMNSITAKPVLSDSNKDFRFQFCCNEILPNGLFNNMDDRIHIDEKWFYVDKVTRHFYLSENEGTPYKTTQHKSHLEKVMFLCAVARPRYNVFNNNI